MFYFCLLVIFRFKNLSPSTAQDNQLGNIVSNSTIPSDYRQRFFIQNSPVRGDVVKLADSFATVIAQKVYPKALEALLGEMLVAASLLISTLKIEGKLSIQLQSSDQASLLRFAMAECDHTGALRALAGFNVQDEEQRRHWQSVSTSDEAFALMDKGVLFISIHPEFGESYQGIVERVSDNLAECLAHYQKQSAQIPTLIKLATNSESAGGILLQLLPQSVDEQESDPDLWDRLTALTDTIKEQELTELPANEILYRLYHEEEVALPELTPLHFGCTCSEQKSQSAVMQLGLDEALNVLEAHQGTLTLDCGFCGKEYRFDKQEIEKLFVEV